MSKNNFFLVVLISLFLFGCQKNEISNKILINYNNLPNLNIIAKTKEIKNIYKPNFIDTYIDHSLVNPPIDALYNWLQNNIDIYSSENKLIINIIEASLQKNEIDNLDTNKYKEKTVFLFKMNYVVEFILYDENGIILATTIAKSERTTTSSKYISLFENEEIIALLVYQSLIDFTKESEKLIKTHMSYYLN